MYTPVIISPTLILPSKLLMSPTCVISPVKAIGIRLASANDGQKDNITTHDAVIKIKRDTIVQTSYQLYLLCNLPHILYPMSIKSKYFCSAWDRGAVGQSIHPRFACSPPYICTAVDIAIIVMVIPGVCINNRGIVANFLEPWYGIGTVASAFGLDYVWKEGQAPVVRPRFIRQTPACAGATLSPRKRGLLVARVTE